MSHTIDLNAEAVKASPVLKALAQRAPKSKWMLSASGEFGLSMLLVAVGCFLLFLANESLGPFVLAALFLGLGLAVHLPFGKAASHERRAFLLTFGVCALIAGLSQWYGRQMLGQLQNERDAVTFYEMSVDGLTGESLEELKTKVNAPLAVVIYQSLYSFTHSLGLDDGPWVGVMLNTLIVALSASLTVLIGHSLYGNDPRRLRLIGTLFAACGLFWLMGAIFVRDSFALILNVVLVLSYVHLLRYPGTRNLALAVGVTLFVFVCMLYVREYYTHMLLLFAWSAVVSWLQRHRGGLLLALLVAFFGACALLLVEDAQAYLGKAAETSLERRETYAVLTESEMEADSLSYRLVTGQHPAVRMITGTVYLHVFPIPLWFGFDLRASEYQWIKSFEGFFMVGLVPLVVAGLAAALRRIRRHEVDSAPLCFLVIYSISCTMVVVATSMETRHHGQFVPAYMVLAALPQLRDKVDRRIYKLTQLFWFSTVVFGHLVWLLIKYRS